MTHLGILGDRAIRAANVQLVRDDVSLKLCRRCDGTGNELYAMYRRCSECLGEGVVDDPA